MENFTGHVRFYYRKKDPGFKRNAHNDFWMSANTKLLDKRERKPERINKETV